MTNLDTIEILGILESNYQPFKDLSVALNLWATCFAEDDYSLVKAAVLHIIQHDDTGFRPTIGKVRKVMVTMTYGEAMNEMEAWNLVKEAAHNVWSSSSVSARKEWEKLPEVIRNIIQPRQFREWGMLSTETFETVIQSNFMRSFRDAQQKDYEAKATPNWLKLETQKIRDHYGLYQGKPTPADLALPPAPKMIPVPEEREHHELSDRGKKLLDDLRSGEINPGAVLAAMTNSKSV